MALMLSGPVLADNSVNDCLDQLKARVSAVPGLASVYGYRSAKATLPVEVAITSTGDIPGNSPVGLSAAYDYIIFLWQVSSCKRYGFYDLSVKLH